MDSAGKRRRPWLLHIVLSHSRKAYSQAVYRQTTEEFSKVLENAFHYFEGVPRALVIDNHRAAVRQADWYGPEIHPRIQSFAVHYGTVFRTALSDICIQLLSLRAARRHHAFQVNVFPQMAAPCRRMSLRPATKVYRFVPARRSAVVGEPAAWRSDRDQRTRLSMSTAGQLLHMSN